MASTPILKLGVGTGTTCAVLQDDTGWCWGSIALLNGGPNMHTYPIPILNSSDDDVFSSIAAGEKSSCGILKNGTLECWGSPMFQLDGTSTVDDWKYVSLANSHACGIVEFGAALCWGICAGDECGPDSSLSLAEGDRLFRIPNPTPEIPWVQIETSNRMLEEERFNAHTCGIKSDGTAWCWGDNAFGQLGIGNKASTSTPTKVSGPNLWRDICTGRGYTCGIDTDGLLLCWGLKIPVLSIDESSSLLEIYGTIPIVVDPDRVTRDIWYTVSCGYYHACVIKATDGSMHCWGENNFGQLGDGSTQPAELPQLVKADSPVIWEESGAGEGYTCGMPIDLNQVYCWGSTANGQLGIGDTEEAFITTPRLVSFSVPQPPPPPLQEPPSIPVQNITAPPPPQPPPQPLPLPPPPQPVVAPSPAPAPIEEESSTNIAAIAGGAVGGVVALCLLALLIFFVIRRRRKRQGDGKDVTGDVETASAESDKSSPTHPDDKDDDDVMPPAADDDDDNDENVFAIPMDNDDEPGPSAPIHVQQQEQEATSHIAIPVAIPDSPGVASEEIQEEEEEVETDMPQQEEEEEVEETSFGTSIAAFDTTVLEEKLSLERSPNFVQMFHLTQHFDKAPEYRSKSEKYTSWYKPVDTLDTGKSMKRSKYKFLCEYEGKMSGLQKTADALQNWSSSKRFEVSCKKIGHLIQDITPTVWELGIMSSTFHTKRIKYGLPWDESLYLDVYRGAQNVAYNMCKKALEIVDADNESSSNKNFYLLMDVTEVLFRIYSMCGGFDERTSSVCPAFLDRVNLYLHQKDPIWYRSRQN